MEPSSREFTRRIQDVMRRLVQHHIRALSLPGTDEELTRSQIATLSQIGRAGPLRMGELAEALGIAPGSLTGVVDRLIEKKLVARERDREDRRRVVVRLTDAGQKVFERFQQAAGRFSESLTALLEPEEMETLLRLMTRLVEGLEKR